MKNATNKKLKYTSPEKKVAEVFASGPVTAKSEGEARIRATATDGSDEYLQAGFMCVSGLAKWIPQAKKCMENIRP